MRLLVAYERQQNFTNTVEDYLLSFQAYFPGDVDYIAVGTGVYVTSGYVDDYERFKDLDLSEYDAVFINYCARLCVQIENYISPTFLDKVSKFEGVTAISIQDEYDWVETERAALDRLQPDIVFT